MKLKRLFCLVLLCLVLCGCSSQKNAGNMEDALDALLWQDYDTAFREADDFLGRLPENQDAQLVRQAAAWGKFNEEEVALKLSKGTWTQLDYGFRVDDLPQKKKSDIQITGYWVGMDYDRQRIDDRDVLYFYLRSMTIYWTDAAGTEYAYEILSPEDLTCKDMAQSILALPGDGNPAADTAELKVLAQLAEKVVAPSMKEVFKKLEKQTGLTPEHLGFTAWNS